MANPGEPIATTDLPVVVTPGANVAFIAQEYYGGAYRACLVPFESLNIPESGAVVEWGGISGSIAIQSDLTAALAGKRNTADSIPAGSIITTSAARFITDAQLTKLGGIEEGATADQTAEDVVAILDGYFGGTAWRTGAGSALQLFDEETLLGQQTKLKFQGAGVSAAVDGDAVEVTIPGDSGAGVAGADREVQFNNNGAMAGAAGIKIKSPANGPGYADHILHANTYTGGCEFATVPAGGGFWPDSAHDVAYVLSLQGNCTLHGANVTVTGNKEMAATKLRLVNTTAAAVTVTVNTAAGQFNATPGLANPFSIAAGAQTIVYACAYRDGSGSLTRTLEG